MNEKIYQRYLTGGARDSTELLSGYLTAWKVTMLTSLFFFAVSTGSTVISILATGSHELVDYTTIHLEECHEAQFLLPYVDRAYIAEHEIALRWWTLAIAIVLMIGGIFLSIVIRHRSSERFFAKIGYKDEETEQLEKTYQELLSERETIRQQLDEQSEILCAAQSEPDEET